jgi:hypothetical protein
VDDVSLILVLGVVGLMVYGYFESQQQGGGASPGLPGIPGGGYGGNGGQSRISQIIAVLESGGGMFAGQQPASMVDPVYGQYAAFANQYGSGPAGVDNYAAQVLALNPNATFGEFYSSYVLGTGNPAVLFSPSDLQAQYPSAYNNMLHNAGVAPDTPLAAVVG